MARRGRWAGLALAALVAAGCAPAKPPRQLAAAPGGDGMPSGRYVADTAPVPPDQPQPEEFSETFGSTTHGALQVLGPVRIDGTYDALQNGKSASPLGYPPNLNTSILLPPGPYDVVVNKSVRQVTIRPGVRTTVRTGALVVEGDGADWWAPFQGESRKVASTPPALNAAVALFRGSYSVVVHVGDKDVKLADTVRIEPGVRTVLKK